MEHALLPLTQQAKKAPNFTPAMHLSSFIFVMWSCRLKKQAGLAQARATVPAARPVGGFAGCEAEDVWSMPYFPAPGSGVMPSHGVSAAGTTQSLAACDCCIPQA